MTDKKNHVSLVFTGPHLWATFGIFNANAFPTSLGNNVRVCATRMALCLLYSDELKISVTSAKRDFLMSLEKHQADGERGLQNRKDDLRFVAYSDGLRYIAGLYEFVNAVKSFLDVYANLMGKLISLSLNWSFKRGKVEGMSLAGGKMIRWLDNCSPKNFPCAVNLAEATRLRSENWITSLVAYRDDLSHYRDLAGFVHMSKGVKSALDLFE